MNMLSFFTEHIYFLAALIHFILWTVLVVADRASRRQMILVGVITAVLGVFVQAMHLTDWWRPNFVFNTAIKIEDVIFGFSSGGIFLAVYNIIRSKLRITSASKINTGAKLLIISIFLFVLFGPHYIWGIHSFITSILATFVLIGIAITWNDKIVPALLVTGVFSVIFAMAGYLFVTYLDPVLVQKTYLLDQLSGLLALGIPIEELVWFFFASMATGAFREIFLSDGLV